MRSLPVTFTPSRSRFTTARNARPASQQGFQHRRSVPFEHGGASSGIYAFDTATGKQRWKSASPNGAGHWASPLLANLDGVRTLVVGGHGLFGLDPMTGSTLWSFAGLLHGDEAPSPAVAGGVVFTCFDSADAVAVSKAGKKWTKKETLIYSSPKM